MTTPRQNTTFSSIWPAPNKHRTSQITLRISVITITPSRLPTGSVPIRGRRMFLSSEQANPEWKWWYWKYYARDGVYCHRIPGRHLQILSPDYIPWCWAKSNGSGRPSGRSPCPDPSSTALRRRGNASNSGSNTTTTSGRIRASKDCARRTASPS